MNLRCVPIAAFEAEVTHAAASLAGAPDPSLRACIKDDRGVATQIRYLRSYLTDASLGATWIAVESPYVDRHYLEEFAGYYAANLQPPLSKTTRLHFFKGQHAEHFLEDAVKEAVAVGDVEAVQRRLQGDYLGAMVVRPLREAPIGRTLLIPFNGDDDRIYAPAQTTHRVHLCGFTLEAPALPFQQQDVAVGACATTALWSALARAMRANGSRAPTPLAVTRAATEYAVTGRGLPATDGLNLDQMLAAVRAFGYSPLVLKPNRANNHPAFVSAIITYLRSGIPVILRISGAGQGHAITLAGYRRSGSERLEITGKQSLRLRTVKPVRFYAHDDRLGPYARLEIEKKADEFETLRVRYAPKAAGFDEFEDPVTVEHAIVPLYPKLRLTAEDLTAFAWELLPMMKQVAGNHVREALFVETRFVLAGDYLREIYGLGLGASRTREVVMTCDLSRYVGILRFCFDAEGSARHLVDVVLDTTDIRRANEHAHILAMIAGPYTSTSALQDAAKTMGMTARVL